MISKNANPSMAFQWLRTIVSVCRENASGSSTAAPTAVRARTSTGTDTPSTAILIIRYGMPQMMLIARNRIHPRELTYLPYETWTNEIPGWRLRWPPQASNRTSESSTPMPRPLLPPLPSSGARSARSPTAWCSTATASRKADPQLVRNATDQVIGGVAPTGHPHRVRTIVDETLARYPVIWTAAGNADSVMPMTYEQLLVVTDGVAMAVR